VNKHPFSLRTALVTASLALMCTACRTEAPFPPVTSAPEPTAAASTINVRTSISTSAIATAINGVVQSGPVQAELNSDPYNTNINGGADNCGNGVSLGYSIQPGNVSVSGSGSTLTASTALPYWMKARFRYPCFIVHPLVYVSCGVNETMPSFALGLSATLQGIDQHWTPRITTSDSLSALNPCRVSALNIDVTGHIQDAANHALNDALPRISLSAAGALNLPGRAGQAWSALEQPIKLGPTAWLSIHPQRAGVSPLQATAGSVSASIGVVARPMVSLGSSAPPADTQPLPPPTPVAPSNQYRIELPVRAPYDLVTAQLEKDLPFYYCADWVSCVKVDGARLSGYGNKVVLEMDGRVSGIFASNAKVYLIGTPSYNATTHVISFPDLEFTLESRNVLLNVAAWIEGDRVRDLLRDKVHYDISKQLTDAKAELQSAMNRPIGPATLFGTVDHLTFEGLYSADATRTVTAIFEADGTLNVTI
jgi:hypothetical protein